MRVNFMFCIYHESQQITAPALKSKLHDRQRAGIQPTRPMLGMQATQLVAVKAGGHGRQVGGHGRWGHFTGSFQGYFTGGMGCVLPPGRRYESQQNRQQRSFRLA